MSTLPVALGDHVVFTRLVLEVSTSLADASLGDADSRITGALASVGSFVGADRAYVFLFRPDGMLVDNTHEWCAAGISKQATSM